MSLLLRVRRTGALAASLALALLGGAIGNPASASAATPLQLGAYVPNAPGSGQILDDYAAMVGRRPDIVHWFRDLKLPLFYSNEKSNLEARGGTPMISWEPLDGSSPIPLGQIASGAYDSYVVKAAQLAKTWSGQVLIRFAHEMNLPSMPWGSTDSATYVSAWRHIVTVFRQQGASNVKWVWSPNVDYGGRPFSSFFPGDAYVDYVALDGYNWGSVPGERWQSFSEVFDSSYQTLIQLSTRPVMVAETSASETGGDKAAWIRQAFLNDIPSCFPRVSAVVWFDKVQEDDWRVNSSTGSLAAYRSVVASQLYGGAVAPSSAPSCDTTPPVVKRLKVTRRIASSRSKAQASRTGHYRARGMAARGKIAYRLSEAAAVEIKIERLRHGRRFKRVAALSRSGHEGRNVLRFSGRVGRHRLRGGRYRVAVEAVDQGGNRSNPRRARFKVI